MTTELVATFTKRYGAGSVVDIHYVQPAESFNVTALFGPSGCGKTTMLRCLAGLASPNQGTIQFRDETWFSEKERISKSPQRRDIGFLFQDYSLFPHLSVSDNIGFGIQSLTQPARVSRISEMLSLFGLNGLERRYPHQLSGGQQQRVALARSLARRPRLLLLDEPLSALDTILREQLRIELRQVLQQLAIPVIIVTHDRVEAISLADRIAVMNEGQICQVGTITEVFTRPKDAEMARLVGMETVVPGEIIGINNGLATVRVGNVQLLAVAPAASDRFVHVCIKGEDVAIQKGTATASSVRNHLPATIRSLTNEGALIRVALDCGFELTSLITRPACDDLQLQVGNLITAMMKTPAIHLISRAE